MTEEERAAVIKETLEQQRKLKNARHKAWRDANIEKVRDYHRAYRAANADHLKEMRRKGKENKNAAHQ